MNVEHEVRVAQETVNDEFVTINKIHVQPQQFVKKGDPLVDIETSKTIITLEAEVEGHIDLCCQEGTDVGIGNLLLKIAAHNNVVEVKKSTIDKKELPQKSTPDVTPKLSLNTESQVITQFSSAALSLIDQYKLDKDIFKDIDFVDKHDVLNIVNPKTTHKPTSSLNLNSNLSRSTPLSSENQTAIEIKPISKAKKQEIKYLSDVQAGLMNSTLTIHVNAKPLFPILNNYLKIFQDSVLPIVIYETTRLLKKFPILNSYLYNENLAYYKDINIGVAVDIDDGLKVLTLYNTDQYTIENIEENLLLLIDKYQKKKLNVSDLSHSTFTITDLSSYGIDFFTPLINTRQSAILGIGKMDLQSKTFYLTLTFDHRVTEGKIGSQFLLELKNRIESYNIGENFDNETLNDFLQTTKCNICHKSLYEDKIMQGHGLIKRTNHQGQEDYMCYTCLAGY